MILLVCVRYFLLYGIHTHRDTDTDTDMNTDMDTDTEIFA